MSYIEIRIKEMIYENNEEIIYFIEVLFAILVQKHVKDYNEQYRRN